MLAAQEHCRLLHARLLEQRRERVKMLHPSAPLTLQPKRIRSVIDRARIRRRHSESGSGLGLGVGVVVMAEEVKRLDSAGPPQNSHSAALALGPGPLILPGVWRVEFRHTYVDAPPH